MSENKPSQPVEVVTFLGEEYPELRRNRQALINATVYQTGANELTFQFWGWAVVLLPDGRWFWTDTSGG